MGDFVTTEDGTGLVHIAPAFGQEDMELSKKDDLPILKTVGPDGTFIPQITPVAGCVHQRCRPVHHHGSAGARPDVPLGEIYPYLPFLLALRHTLAVLCTRYLVHPHQQVQGPPGRTQQQDQLGARAHPGRPLWQLALQQYRLGALPRALLGYTPAGVGMPRLQEPRMCRLGKGTFRKSRARPVGAGPAPPACGRHHLGLRQVRRQDEPRARPDRCLVRLWLHAGGSMALSLREPGAVRAAAPGRFHLRSGGSDARLVLYPARHQHSAVRPGVLQERDLPGPGGGCQRTEDVEEQRQCGRPLGCAE